MMYPLVKTQELVLNWHVTEACNYDCKYCYAAWQKVENREDVIRNQNASEALIAELHAFFQPGNTENPLYNQMQWKTVRLNFAGGEPLLYDRKISRLIEYAKGIGLEVSLITNASRMSSELISTVAPQLSWLGLSIDSFNADTSRSIGRVDKRGTLLDIQRLANDITSVRKANPHFRLKINTVVNERNWTENMTALVSQFAPEKWKVLRMLPVVNQNLAITDLQFGAFVRRHEEFKNIVCVEDNNDMLQSYIMIDPKGRFFQNSQQTINTGYQYSEPIVEVGARSAFSKMAFNADCYAARYDEVAS